MSDNPQMKRLCPKEIPVHRHLPITPGIIVTKPTIPSLHKKSHFSLRKKYKLFAPVHGLDQKRT